MPVTSEVHGSFIGHFFGTMWTVISTFFGTVWFLTSSFFGAFFRLILPATIACIIICGVLFAAVVAIMATAHGLGWVTLKPGTEKKQKKKASEAEEDTSDEVLVDVSNNKRRVEIEIEFLEELLRAKREKLKKLD